MTCACSSLLPPVTGGAITLQMARLRALGWPAGVFHLCHPLHCISALSHIVDWLTAGTIFDQAQAMNSVVIWRLCGNMSYDFFLTEDNPSRIILTLEAISSSVGMVP